MDDLRLRMGESAVWRPGTGLDFPVTVRVPYGALADLPSAVASGM
jgi:hypothetical protein